MLQPSLPSGSPTGPVRLRKLRVMTEPEELTPGADDTAAFQAFYRSDHPDDVPTRGWLYRVLVGWWRDRE